MQSSHLQHDKEEQCIISKEESNRTKAAEYEKKFYKNDEYNTKELLDEDLEEMIHNLTYELNEAREQLRKKAYAHSSQIYDSKPCKKNFKNMAENSINVVNSFDDQDVCEVKNFYYNKSNNANISNSTIRYAKSETTLQEIRREKRSGQKFNVDALKKLLVVVNKINKTYDPVRI